MANRYPRQRRVKTTPGTFSWGPISFVEVRAGYLAQGGVIREALGPTREIGRRGTVGISLGGILVIAGIVLMFVWSFWAGLIVALIGLIAFGGFARGKWY